MKRSGRFRRMAKAVRKVPGKALGAMANAGGRAVDAMIEKVAPIHQLKRVHCRHATMAIRNAYTGASKDRNNKDWLAIPDSETSADSALLGHDELTTLRERSRELCRNDPIARSIVRVFVDNVVGTGIRPQSQVDAKSLGITEKQAATFQDSAERAFDRATPWLDSTDRTDFFGLQRIVVNRLLVDGEMFAHPVELQGARRPILTAIEMIEGDRVSDPDSQGKRNERIRAGVVLGKIGQPIAYWVQVGHPGDDGLSDLGPRRGRSFRRLNAVQNGVPNVLHVYDVMRSPQTRGEPWFAPIIPDLKDLAGYLTSERISARVESCFSAWVTKADPLGAALQNRKADGTSKKGEELDPLEELQPGMVEYLAPGESVEFGDPKRPGSTFADFVEHLIRRAGAPVGLSLELVLCDFSKTNYTSGRMAGLEADRKFKATRWLLNTRFSQPVYEAVLTEAARAGELEGVTFAEFIKNKDLWTRARWVQPARGWVDRNKEVPASVAAIEAGLSTKAVECAAQGFDWEENLRQNLREEQREEELRFELGMKPKQQPPQAPPSTDEQSSDDNAENSKDSASEETREGSAAERSEQDAETEVATS